MFNTISILSLESSGSNLKKHLVWEWKSEIYWWKNCRMQVRITKIWKRCLSFGIFDVKSKILESGLPFDVQLGLLTWTSFLTFSHQLYQWWLRHTRTFFPSFTWSWSWLRRHSYKRPSASQFGTSSTKSL